MDYTIERKRELKAIISVLPSNIPNDMLKWTASNIEEGIWKSCNRNLIDYECIAAEIKINLDDKSSSTSHYLVELVYRYLKYLIIKAMFHKAGDTPQTPEGPTRPCEISRVCKKYLPDYDFDNQNVLMSIGSMAPVDLNPDINKPYLQAIAIKMDQKIERKFSRLYKCGVCGDQRVDYYEIQTRSLDEPGTLFLICLTCGKKWTSAR